MSTDQTTNQTPAADQVDRGVVRQPLDEILFRVKASLMAAELIRARLMLCLNSICATGRSCRAAEQSVRPRESISVTDDRVRARAMKTTTIRTRIIRQAVSVDGRIRMRTVAAWSAGDLHDPIHETSGAIVMIDGDRRRLCNWGYDVPAAVTAAFAAHRAALIENTNCDSTISHEAEVTIDEMVL